MMIYNIGMPMDIPVDEDDMEAISLPSFIV